jgi:hypothetical protein
VGTGRFAGCAPTMQHRAYRKHWPQCHWPSPMTRWVISARAIQAPDGRLSAMPPIATDVAAMQRMTPCANNGLMRRKIISTNRKTASRRSLRNSITYYFSRYSLPFPAPTERENCWRTIEFQVSMCCNLVLGALFFLPNQGGTYDQLHPNLCHRGCFSW